MSLIQDSSQNVQEHNVGLIQDQSQNVQKHNDQDLEESEVDSLDTDSQNFENSGFYNYYQKPANLEYAQLHGQSFRIQKLPYPASKKCRCCNFAKNFVKYGICDDNKFQHEYTAVTEYFELIKYYLQQLLIIGIILVPYGLIFHKLGDRCEQIESCDTNSTKVYSIWNLADKFKSLDDPLYKALIYITYFILNFRHFRVLQNPRVAYKKMLTANKQEFLKENSFYLKFEEMPQGTYKLIHSKYFIDLIFDSKGYEDFLFSLLKEKQFHNQDFEFLIQELTDDTFIEEHIKGILVYFGKIDSETQEFILKEFEKMNLQIEKYEDQDWSQDYKCKHFLYPIIYSYYLTRTIIGFTIFFRVQFFSTYVTGEDLQSLRATLNLLLSLFQLLLIKISDILAESHIPKSLMNLHYTFQICALIDLSLCGNFKEWTDCFFPTPNSDGMLIREGLVDNMITLSLLNIVLPWLLSIFDLDYMIKLKNLREQKQKGLPINQLEANHLFEKRDFNVSQKRRTINKIFYFSLTLLFHYPLIIPSSIISLSMIYIVDKYLFVNHSKPSKLDKGDELLKSNQFQFLYFSYIQLIAIGNSVLTINWVDYTLISISCLMTVFLYSYSIYTFYKKVILKIEPTHEEINKFQQQFNSLKFINGKFYLQKDEMYKIYTNLKKRLNLFKTSNNKHLLNNQDPLI